MKLGDKVFCTAYIKKSGNHYELNNDIMYAVIHSPGSESYDIGDDLPHNCPRYTIITKNFDGIYCGKTIRCTELMLDVEYEPYSNQEHYRISLENPKDFAVVYYADNKRRFVPIDCCNPA